MTVKCFVSRPGRSRARSYEFMTLPRIDESITLPGYFDDFIVESIAHVARKSGDSSRPTVHIRLRTLTPKEVHRPIGFLAHQKDIS